MAFTEPQKESELVNFPDDLPSEIMACQLLSYTPFYFDHDWLPFFPSRTSVVEQR